jgi:hypothetical protein
VADATFDCAISCTSDAHLWVDGVEVPLDESGFTKTGKFTAQTGKSITLKAQIEGAKGSGWTLDITPECPGKQPPKLWSRSGIFKTGGVMLSGAGQAPDDPCVANDGLDLVHEVLPEQATAPIKVSAPRRY